MYKPQYRPEYIQGAGRPSVNQGGPKGLGRWHTWDGWPSFLLRVETVVVAVPSNGQRDRWRNQSGKNRYRYPYPYMYRSRPAGGNGRSTRYGNQLPRYRVPVPVIINPCRCRYRFLAPVRWRKFMLSPHSVPTCQVSEHRTIPAPLSAEVSGGQENGCKPLENTSAKEPFDLRTCPRTNEQFNNSGPPKLGLL